MSGMTFNKYIYGPLLLAGVGMLGLTVGFAPDNTATRQMPQATTAEFSPQAPATIPAQDTAPRGLAQTLADKWYSIEIKRGDKLTTVFEQIGVGVHQAQKILALGGEASALSRLDPGDKLKIKVGAEGRLQELLYDINPARTLHIVKEGPVSDFQTNTVEHPLERRIARVSGAVGRSLPLAGKKAGLPGNLAKELPAIFDSAADVHRGDRFAVLYEEFYAQGEKIRNGAILAAELVNRGETLRAVRFTDGKGRSSYYTPEGKRIRKSFLSTPVESAHISSGFSLGRLHPILNTIRAHNGIDYAAPIGTPVKAASDGTVSFIGNKAGYGKTVILQHGKQYSTLYAHLSRYPADLTLGAQVAQGRVIGYVGQSGLATGPHLHYEFRVNDVYRNPLTANIARVESIERRYKADFARQAQELTAQLESFKRTVTASSR